MKVFKNRGMLLESIINKTIVLLEEWDIALIHKKNLDLKFKNVNKRQKTVEGARIINKSTVDYYGIYKGYFLAFEAKSVEEDYFPLSNIKKHQWSYLKKVDKHLGISFIILFFKLENRFFLIFFQNLVKVSYKLKKLKIKDCEDIGWSLELMYPGILNFIKIIEKKLNL